MARVKRAVNSRKNHKSIKACKRLLRWEEQIIQDC